MAVWAVGLQFDLGTVSVGDAAPHELSLANAGAEPVRGSGAVRFTLPAKAQIDLVLYDPAGRRVRSLQRGRREASEYYVTWSAAGLQPGRYFLALEVKGAGRKTLPVTVLR
jgi:hypothetical protein